MKSPSGTAGAYNKVMIKKGMKYRLRLINTGLDNHFKVSLDSHILTVIAADFVPIVPYNTTWLFIAIGQRYDVIFTASKDVGNYWFRAEVQQGCGQNSNNGNIRSIFSYEGADNSDPTSTATNYTQSCADETSLLPYFSMDVPADQFTGSQARTLTVGGPNRIPINNSTNPASTIFSWNMNGSAINVDWAQPTLQYIFEDNTNYPPDLNIIQLPDANMVSNPSLSPLDLNCDLFFILTINSGLSGLYNRLLLVLVAGSLIQCIFMGMTSIYWVLEPETFQEHHSYNSGTHHGGM
jgi:hypothetical protein